MEKLYFNLNGKFVEIGTLNISQLVQDKTNTINNQLKHPVVHNPIQVQPIQHQPIQHNPIQHQPLEHGQLELNHQSENPNVFQDCFSNIENFKENLKNHVGGNFINSYNDLDFDKILSNSDYFKKKNPMLQIDTNFQQNTKQLEDETNNYLELSDY